MGQAGRRNYHPLWQGQAGAGEALLGFWGPISDAEVPAAPTHVTHAELVPWSAGAAHSLLPSPWIWARFCCSFGTVQTNQTPASEETHLWAVLHLGNRYCRSVHSMALQPRTTEPWV